MAISIITRARCVPWRSAVLRRPAACNVGCSSERAVLNAGARPNAMPAMTEAEIKRVASAHGTLTGVFGR